MSLVPYLVPQPEEPMPYAPVALTAAFMLAAMLMQEEEPVPAPAVAPPTPPAAPKHKEKKPETDPLDADLFRILAEHKNPMTAREMARLLPGVEKSKINSRLYKLHCLHKVLKCDTKGAPLWFL
jgi:hypothetical protein